MDYKVCIFTIFTYPNFAYIVNLQYYLIKLYMYSLYIYLFLKIGHKALIVIQKYSISDVLDPNIFTITLQRYYLQCTEFHACP